MREIDFLAIWFLVIFGVLVPYMAIRSARRVQEGAPIPPRPKLFLNVLVMQALFLAISLFAAQSREIPIFARGEIHVGAVKLGAVLLALALTVMPQIWRFTPDEQKRRLLLSRPRESRDLGLWFLVSLAAGIVEEITYRGVLFALMLPITTSLMGGPPQYVVGDWSGDRSAGWWLSVLICVMAFVLGHARQGWPRAIFLSFFALGCHVLVRMTGSLVPAMALHFTYDFLGGILYIRLGRKFRAAPADPHP